MSDWKTSLDRWLTTPPEDPFGDYIEAVLQDKVLVDFYDEQEGWLEDDDGLFVQWTYRLYERGKSPMETGIIIQRAFKIYQNGSKTMAKLEEHSDKWNRAKHQCKELLELCDYNFDKLERLENKIKQFSIAYSPADKEAVWHILNKY